MRPRRGFQSCVLLGALALCGCSSPLGVRSQSPEPTDDPAVTESGAQLVGELTVPLGLNYLEIEGIGLVTGLADTGSDPPPSPLRDSLLNDMKTYEVAQPNGLLASPTTSLVLVRGFLPPGVQKGDRFDIELQVPARSETSSLNEGWLMKTRLREMRILGSEMHTGRITGLAKGPVIVDAVFKGSEDPFYETHGRVLGGGVALTDRPMGLVVRGEHKSVKTSALIANSINQRFHVFDRGQSKGVATAKRDNLIELVVEPRYRRNVGRFMAVIQSIAVDESGPDRIHRAELLQRMLLEPTTSAKAALQLEALGGEQASAILREGLKSPDPEVRFHAAESLAYLDESDAAEELAAAASTRAFRWHAFRALAVMDHVSAYDALTRLLNDRSAETRYGAFQALRKRNPRDPLVSGEVLGDRAPFVYHVVTTTGEPMVHFSRTDRPEVVLFGHQQQLRPPAFLFAGREIVIKGQKDGRLKVSRFSPGKEDLVEFCSSEVDDLIRAITRVGGGYGDILQALQSAKRSGDLESRIVVGARPRPGRVYQRADSKWRDDQPDDPSEDADDSLTEDLASSVDGEIADPQTESALGSAPGPERETTEDEERRPKGIFDRIKGRISG